MVEIKSSISAAIAIVVVTIVLLALTPTIIHEVDLVCAAAVAPATKWNFTGASGAISMMGLVPFVWVAAVLLAAVAGMWAIVKGKD